mmetsp:Transcript_63216/g.102233  ORF Transcript_63216/g.102233 Transcript_63216/m.102233 type:complete len:214 (+) Transcript_63216:88-729(+)
MLVDTSISCDKQHKRCGEWTSRLATGASRFPRRRPPLQSGTGSTRFWRVGVARHELRGVAALLAFRLATLASLAEIRFSSADIWGTFADLLGSCVDITGVLFCYSSAPFRKYGVLLPKYGALPWRCGVLSRIWICGALLRMYGVFRFAFLARLEIDHCPPPAYHQVRALNMARTQCPATTFDEPNGIGGRGKDGGVGHFKYHELSALLLHISK